MGRLTNWITRQVEKDAARDEQAARARRIGAQATRDEGLGAGLAAWSRESSGATRNGQLRMPRTECDTCHTSHVRRADGRPVARRRGRDVRRGGGPGA